MSQDRKPLKTEVLLNKQGIAKTITDTNGVAQWKTGYAWKNGKHYAFDKEQITVTQGWPGLRVWTRGINTSWKGSRFSKIDRSLCDSDCLEKSVLEFQAKLRSSVTADEKPLSLQEFAQLKNDHALLELQKTIPPDVLARTRRFWHRRWHLLCFQARVPGAADLIDSNPALGWMLANHWIFRNGLGKSDATRIARRWVRKPQREILKWLGFDGSKSTRRIVARIDPYIADAPRLLYLRTGLLDDEVKRAMQHLQAFTADTLRIATDPGLLRRVTPSFLREVSEEDVRCTSTHIASKLKEALFHESEYEHKIPKSFHTVKQLAALQPFHLPSEQLPEPRYSDEYIQKTPFPLAPWLGVPGIEPLTDYMALLEEGEAMKHCVGTYSSSVLQGDCYIYSVSHPMRATLEARRVKGSWILGEVSGRKNAAIETSRAVYVWQRLTGKSQLRSLKI